MEKFRKIIKFGTSSFVLSLPIDWTKKNNLGKGDLVSISENVNNELVLSVPSKDRSTQRREIGITNLSAASSAPPHKAPASRAAPAAGDGSMSSAGIKNAGFM